MAKNITDNIDCKSEWKVQRSSVNLLDDLDKTARVYGNFMNHQLPGELTYEQYLTLISLYKRDGQSQIQIAQSTGKDKSSVTRILDLLERKKFIARIQDKSDRRRNHIFLTPLGETEVKKSMTIIEDAEEKVFTCISKRDITVFENTLIKIIKNLIH